jgi:small subunit ribosomal protein S3Ae
LATQKSQDKWKSKKWFTLYAPKVLEEVVLGEIPAADEKSVTGRVIKISLFGVTKNPSHNFLSAGFKIESASGNAAHSSINYIENSFSYLHSLVRTNTTAIYTVNGLKDKEGKGFVLKMLIVAANKIGEAKQKVLRKLMADFLKEYSASKTVDDTIKDLISGSLQAEAKKMSNKIAPIAKLELKRIEIGK